MMQPKPDWFQMSLLYRSLWVYEPTPVVALNWAVVMAELGQCERASQRLDELQTELENYQPLYAARAYVLNKLGHFSEACAAYHHAIQNAPNDASRRFLVRELQRCSLASAQSVKTQE